ncbi:MAG: hypothetical protein GY765_42105, partial [bacterium]|nr:hypothetical protein [bacterium]
KRTDKVIVACEIKYREGKIGPKIIPEMEKKCSALQVPRGYTLEKALISVYGPDEELRTEGYFHYYVTLDDIIK